MSTYQSDNIGVCALLISRGWKVLEVRPSPDNPRRYVCVFSPEAKTDALSYFQGAMVEAKAHQDAALYVLAMIREARNG
jgi:hypothetical protein